MIRKIYRFLSSPLIMSLAWIVFLISPVLGIIRMQFLTSFQFQVLHIKGLSTILFYTPFVVSCTAFIILTLHLKDFISGEIFKPGIRNIYIFLSTITLIALLISGYLLKLEDLNYSNYIYSHYGIMTSQLELYSFICSLELFGVAASFIYLFKIRNSLSSTSIKSSHILERISFVAAIVGMLIMMIISASTFFYLNNYFRDAKLGYTGRIGSDYHYLKILAKETARDVKIVLPPQSNQWPAIGNQPVARYFLFPRILISGALVDNQSFADSLGSVYFPEIDLSASRPVWPIINSINKTIIFDTFTPIKYGELKIVNSDKDKIYKISF